MNHSRHLNRAISVLCGAAALIAAALVATAPAATNWTLYPQTVSQSLATPHDAHIYYFFGREGEVVSVRVEPAAGSALNPAFILTTVPKSAMYRMPVPPACTNPDSTGFTALIADDDSGGAPAAEFSGFRLPQCGTYAIIVHPSGFATSGAYRLTVTPGDADSNAIGYQGNFTGNSKTDSSVRSWSDGHVIFNKDAGETLVFPPGGHTAVILGAFNTNPDSDLRLHRLSDGAEYLSFNDYKTYGFSPDGNFLVLTGLFNSDNNTDVRVYEMPAGVQRVNLNTVKSWSVAPDSRTIALLGLLDSDQRDDLVLYRLADGVRLAQINTVTAFTWSPSGEGMIVRGDFLSGSSVEYRVLNARTGEQIHLNSAYDGEIYSPDGRYAAVFGQFTGGDSTLDLLLYDFHDKRQITASAVRSFTSGVFAPHGRSFVAFGFSNSDAKLDVRVYALPSGTMVHEALDVENFAQFSPDGEILVLRGRFGQATPQTLTRFVRLPAGEVLETLEDISAVHFSPAGTLAVLEGPINDVAGNDFDVRTTEDFTSRRFFSTAGELRFDPSDDYFLVRGIFNNDTITKWEVARTRTGSTVFSAERVTDFDFSPGGDAFWIEYDADEDEKTEKFLISLPDGRPAYSDTDDLIALTFEGWSPRGDAFLISGNTDLDPKTEFMYHASPSGALLYELEDIALQQYSLNGTFHVLTGDFEDAPDGKTDFQIRRTRTGEIVDTRFDPDKVTFTWDEEAAVYEATWEATGRFGYIVYRLAERTGFPQTLDLTSFLLSWDRFNPAVSQSQYAASFEGGTEGWQSGTAALLDPAQFSAADDRLTITAVNNTLSFGFWASPPAAVPAPGDSLLRVVARIQSNVQPDVQTPHFRLRLASDDNQVAALLRVNSPQGSTLMPGPQGKTYTLFFSPPAGADGLTYFLALDQLNFDPTDAPNGDISLDEISVDVVPRAILPSQTLLRTFEFSADEEGWRAFPYPGGTPPTLIWGGGRLQLIPGSTVDSFGFWDGPDAAIANLIEGRLYGARFEVGSTGAVAGRVPGWRLRLQDSGTSITSILRVQSAGPAAVTPTSAALRRFEVYMFAMPGLGGATLFPSIDITAFDPDDDPETIILERVELFRMPPP
ncbi:MAG: hypothetical protein Kow0059_16980 [Candidatus Sumerlaeia bacterium]